MEGRQESTVQCTALDKITCQLIFYDIICIYVTLKVGRGTGKEIDY